MKQKLEEQELLNESKENTEHHEEIMKNLDNEASKVKKYLH